MSVIKEKSIETSEDINFLKMALASIRIGLTKNTRNDIEIKTCLPIITLNEVADHDNMSDCWIILYDRVYDVTEFLYSVSTYIYIYIYTKSTHLFSKPINDNKLFSYITTTIRLE